LVLPHFADECTRQYDLPVLAGVDLVAYWTLPEGSSAVHGSPNLMTVYEGYRFFFSSIENLRAFEVRRNSGCSCSVPSGAAKASTSAAACGSSRTNRSGSFSLADALPSQPKQRCRSDPFSHPAAALSRPSSDSLLPLTAE